MKRLLLMTAVAIALMACEGPEGPAGPPGHDGRDGEGPNWYSARITVHENEWELRGSPGEVNSYFTVYKPLSALNKVIYDRGSVIAYIEVEEGIKNGMPYVLHLGEQFDDGKYLWTQTYDFDFDPEGVAFYVTYSDFVTDMRPGTETFHVVMMW